MAKSSTSLEAPDGKAGAARRAGKPKGARRRVSARGAETETAAKPVSTQRGAPPATGGEPAEPHTEPGVREAVSAVPRDPAVPGTGSGRELPSSAPEAPPIEERAAPSPPASPPAATPVAAAARAEPGTVGSDAPPAGAAISGSADHLVEGTIRLHGELLAFGWRQTEQGLAVGQAMLASRSLPEMVALQSAWLGRTFGDALAHGLVLSRLATEMMRSGPPAG